MKTGSGHAKTKSEGCRENK